MRVITDFIYSMVLLRFLSVIILTLLPAGTYRRLIRSFLSLLLIRLVVLFFAGLISSFG